LRCTERISTRCWTDGAFIIEEEKRAAETSAGITILQLALETRGHRMQATLNTVVRRVAQQTRVRSQTIQSEKCGSGTGLSPSTWIFRCQYHGTDSPFDTHSSTVDTMQG
jgi:hypothetical protein